MPKPEHLNHPVVAIKQFASGLRSGSIDPAKLNQFKKWMESPKCTEELKPVAQELLAEAEAAASAPRPQAARAVAAVSAKGAPPVAGRNNVAADASCIGSSFHNPYTFIEFGSKPVRGMPTLLTQDEIEPERFTGTFQIELKTLSPLLTTDPAKVNEGETHRVLKVNDDVIVPATGLRGAIRSLMTILTGGTLGYVDESVWLCQGRDLPLGPRSERAPNPAVPSHVFLAKIVTVGSATRSGTVQVCRADLINHDDLKKEEPGFETMRPRGGEAVRELRLRNGKYVKLSGRRVGTRGVQREGVFDPQAAREIELPAELWMAYQGRNRHGMRPDLKPGDLVWLEPSHVETSGINSHQDVKSIQWARWGRRGERLIDLIKRHHPQVIPDSMNPDGKVDEVTDLFGQVPATEKLIDSVFPTTDGMPASAFAARLRFDNLVFQSGAKSVETVHLSPMSSPHPGCVAFYRKNADPDAISLSDPLRGYKVYRTTKERGKAAPWLYENQPIYKDGKATLGEKLSKKAELLKEGCTGYVSIAARSLSKREVAIVLLACSVDWRLGGGKPLGLGHCRVMRVRMVDEFGKELMDWPCGTEDLDREQPAVVPDPTYAKAIEGLASRAALYQATQRPVEKLRYPRAASMEGRQRGGHVWFQRHAQAKKAATRDGQMRGLATMWVDGELKAAAGKGQIAAQPLPEFDPKRPNADVLHGHDLKDESEGGGDRKTFRRLVPFQDGPVAARKDDAPPSPNADSRQRDRDRR